MRPPGPPPSPPYGYPPPELHDWPPWNQHTHFTPLDPGEKCSCNTRAANFFLRHPIAAALLSWHVSYVDSLVRVTRITWRESAAKIKSPQVRPSRYGGGPDDTSPAAAN